MTKKEKVDELFIANEEKEKRAAELILANKEMEAFSNVYTLPMNLKEQALGLPMSTVLF